MDYINQRKFSQETSELRTDCQWLAVSPLSSCQSHHHQIVGKPKRSGMREFTAEKILGHKTLVFFVFFQVKWLSVVAAGGSLLPRFHASIRKVVDKMCTGL